MQATQDDQVVLGGATQIGDDNYDSSEEEEAVQEGEGTSALLGANAGSDDDDDESDEDYQEEKKQKRKTRVVVDDDDEEEEGSESKQGGNAPEQPEDSGAPDEEGSDADEESSSSDEEDDDGAPQKRRVPSARQKAKRVKDDAARKRQEKKKVEKPIDEFDMLVSGLKKGKKKELSLDEKNAIVTSTLNTMHSAYRQDREKRKNGQPALEKLKKLDSVLEALTNQELLHTFVDQGVGKHLVDWLKPGKKNLPNIKLRTRLFKAIEKLPFPEHEDSIKNSGIGKILNFYRCHPEETLENKRLTNSIISRWMDILTKSG